MESPGHGVTPLTERRGGSFVKHRFVQLKQQHGFFLCEVSFGFALHEGVVLKEVKEGSCTF